MLAKSAKPASPNSRAVEEELRRLMASPSLHHAESLCQLLKHLVEHSLQKPEEHLKEYQIATDVFGRAESFDPRMDSSVRVQTSRLRNKLSEYYATIGKDDPVIIDIPKGTYLAEFRMREEGGMLPLASPTPVPPPLLTLEQKPVRRPRVWWSGLALFCAIGLGVLSGKLLFSPSPQSRDSKPVTDTRQISAFWSGFLKSREPPLVIFSNAQFKGRPETGLRYFQAQSDSREQINDLYTGVGEVLAIDELLRLFRVLGREMVVKRSALLSWDETRDRDLIFTGSPSENLSLLDLPSPTSFVFRPMRPGEPRVGDLAIVNEHPRPGEPAMYFASEGLPISEDYAVVTLQPGLHPGQNILLLAGTTTLGTQAAAEFVCRNDHLEDLRKRMGLAAAGPFPPFSAVLRVRIARGVPVESGIVALHTLGR